MKNKFFFTPLFILVSLFFLTSCSKERMPSPAAATLDIAGNTNKGIFADQAGHITGRIDPAAIKAEIRLYDATSEFGPYYHDTNSGFFRIPGIPAGTYKFVIRYYGTGGVTDNQGGYTLYVSEVAVNPGAVTDMGVIHL
ncbi:MAG TPA: hypothetical protein PKC72_15365 [Chitinophagaceae bacterium]|nr:hypothetical protein [Chitinophagaceae bacterium]